MKLEILCAKEKWKGMFLMANFVDRALLFKRKCANVNSPDKLFISKYQVYLCNTLPRLFGTSSTSAKSLKTQTFILKCYKALLKRWSSL